MQKNFSPQSLGINGRQSELIELALTYGFRSMDVDMSEMLRRSRRSSVDEAAKYLRAAENLEIGGFPLDINMDAADGDFTSQLGAIHPVAELAAEMKATRAYVYTPAATSVAAYPEYFDKQSTRLGQVADVLAAKNIQLGVGFRAGKELAEGKDFPFIQNVEGLLALVKGVGKDNVGLLIDTWDWVVGDGTAEQLSGLKADQIVAVRIGTIAPDINKAEATTADRVLPVGEGDVNHVDLIKQLVALGFEGPVSPTASSTQYKGQTRESTVQKSQEAIDGICKEAGMTVAPLPMEMIEEVSYEPTPAAT